MKQQLKLKENRVVKKIESPQKESYEQDEIPQKDKDGIDDIIPNHKDSSS